MNRPLALAFVTCLLSSCAQVQELTRPGPAEPPMAVEIKVHGLRKDEQAQLAKTLCSLPGVTGCEQKGSGGETTYSLQYAGSLSALKNRIEAIDHPGLEAEEVKATLKFRGFDNEPPTITLLSPKGDAVLTETNAEIVVEVPQPDVESVRVGDRSMSRTRTGIYQLKLQLVEGENALEVRAVDEGGNAATLPLRLVVDTTPPDVQATVKVVVEGKVERGSAVFVDGQPVNVDLLGNWRAELVIKRGQRTVEIVAIDEHGNKKTEQRSIAVD